LSAAIASTGNINAHDHRDSYSPMHVAAVASNDKVMVALIDKGGDVNARDEDDRTPLMLAYYKFRTHAALALTAATATLKSSAYSKKPLPAQQSATAKGLLPFASRRAKTALKSSACAQATD